tara:strand:- start:492 stop:659 length:168 start_codon:yes stop_codon:yes gene_type:complete
MAQHKFLVLEGGRRGKDRQYMVLDAQPRPLWRRIGVGLLILAIGALYGVILAVQM